jgi:hypothetical protein
MRLTISKLAALCSLASLTGLAYADLATDCLGAGGFTEVTLSNPNAVIESVLLFPSCPTENIVFNAPTSINYIISPTEAGTTAKIYTNSANLVTPSLAGGTLQFTWKTDLPATQTSAGFILKIPRDQLTSLTISGSTNLVKIEDGFTSLSSIVVLGSNNVIKAVTSSTTQPLVYKALGSSNSGAIEAVDVSLQILGSNNIVEIKGAVSNVDMSGSSTNVLVEGDVTKVVANGSNNAISVNGNNGCDGFPAGGGGGASSTCSTSTKTVVVSGTQSCTSSTVFTSNYSSTCTAIAAGGGSITIGGGITIGGVTYSGGSSTARMDRVLVAMVSGVTALMSYLLV